MTSMGAGRTRRVRLVRRFGLLVMVLALVAPVGWAAPSVAQAPAVPGTPRALSCSGSLGEPGTDVTVTANLSATAVPLRTVVTRTSTGAVLSRRVSAAAPLGLSWVHSGYLLWDVTGSGAGSDRYSLSLPPVLAGNGGFTDADLLIEFDGGAAGNLQIPMFDCTITGGPPTLAHPPGVRAFAGTGNDA